MKKKTLLIIVVALIIFLTLLGFIGVFMYKVSPVDKNSEEVIKFEVTENQTLSTLGSSLKEVKNNSYLTKKLVKQYHNVKLTDNVTYY